MAQAAEKKKGPSLPHLQKVKTTRATVGKTKALWDQACANNRRAVFEAVTVGGWSYAAIARELGTSEARIRQIVMRGHTENNGK